MSAPSDLARAPRLSEDLRDQLMLAPELLLEDAGLMRALIAAHDAARGGNIVDLRGAFMRRLEGRLEGLEATHRSVIAAAYENLAGTNLIHRAVIELLTPQSFPDFLTLLDQRMADLLRLDSLRLVLEAQGDDPALRAWAHLIHLVEPGFIASYLDETTPARAAVTLRICPEGAGALHHRAEGHIRSEALLALDLGPGRLPGLLVMGAAEADQFAPRQGTDLLRFFGASFALILRRWLG